jgi:nucleotide-binding universal stress UspA family protein
MTAALPEWNGAIHGVQREATLVRNIVLPIDASEAAWTAIPVAQTLCALYDAKLHVANVGHDELAFGQAANHMQLIRDAVHRPRLVEAGPNPVEAVLELAYSLPEVLTVISTDLGQRVDQDHFGSFTESFFARRPERTIVVSGDRGDKPWQLGHILLAHDGTPGSHAATNPAIDLALRSKADVMALHVASRGQERPEQAGSISAPIYFDQPQHEWPAWAQEFMNRILATGAPASSVHFKLTVSGGQPGSEVAQVARDRAADLVVMTWHGHWDHENCATRVVVRSSGCPVLLVYGGD